MIVVAIDPGTERSALVSFDGVDIQEHYEADNTNLWVNLLRDYAHHTQSIALVIEEIASYGMPVGREVFRTVRWTGFFEAVWHPRPTYWLPRLTVKTHLCHSAKAKDGNIRQALLDRFGPQGVKRAPGKLYGIRSDEWAALAVAVTFWDQRVVNGVVQPLPEPVSEPTSTGQTDQF